MKKALKIISAIVLLCGQQLAFSQNPFITSWSATTEPETISIPLNGSFTYNFDYVWKNAADSSVITSGTHASADGSFDTEFATSGFYFLEITGDFPHFQGYPKASLTDVNQWGDIVWGSMFQTFNDWPGVTFSAEDNPDLSQVTDMAQMFFRATSFNDDLSDWDVSNITAMNVMFRQALVFNQDLSSWDMRNVTSTAIMFENADAFNQDLSAWELSNVEEMSRMFNGADSFDQDLSSWDISKVENMDRMFENSGLSSLNYDQTIAGWAALEGLERNVNLGIPNLSFCSASNARTILEALGWNINFGGQSCGDLTAILSFEVPNQIGTSIIERNNATISANIPFDVSLTAVTPTITLVQGATVNPLSGTVIDFTDTVTYTVSFELSDGGSTLTKEWSVIMMLETIETDILSFSVPEQVVSSVIDEVNHTVNLLVPIGTDVTALVPTFTLSDETTSAPESGIPQDFTTAVTYTVTGKDGLTNQDWIVNIGEQRPFITAWSAVNSESITIELNNSFDYSFDYSWKDSNGDDISSGRHTSADGDFVTAFSETAEVTLEIIGNFPHLTTDYPKDQLLDVIQWGDIQWRSMASSFQNWTGASLSATDDPDLSNVTNMSLMFRGAANFDDDINDWDVGNVTNMSDLFLDASSFNSDIGDWDVSAVTNMRRMFFRSTDFNQDLSDWRPGQVINLSEMFSGAESFTSDLSQWNVNGVTGLAGMFRGASDFNSDLNDWDVSQVTNMFDVFQDAQSFNGNISDWNVSNVTSMEAMFDNADAFNQDLSKWNVSKVTNMSFMFENNGGFNGNIGTWNVERVTTMFRMFEGANAFNQDLTNWNPISLTNMQRMFRNNNSFNGDLSTWNVESVTNMAQVFNSASAFDQDLSGWNIRGASSLNNIFSGSSLSPQNYDKILIGWAALDSVQSDVSLGADGITFCESIGARTLLTDPAGLNWAITDAGQLCTEKNFIAFDLPEVTLVGEAIIDTTNLTVAIGVISGTDLSSVAPQFSVSTEAVSVPASGEIQDFNSPINYEITAQNGAVSIWTVTVTIFNSEADILSFEIPAKADVIDSIEIDDSTQEITIVMLPTETIRFVQPEISVSTGAIISPASGNLIDLSSNTFIYQVTSEDLTGQLDWTVTVETPINTATDFLTFEIPGQIGTSKIDTAAHQIDVTFPEGTALTALTPSFTLSGGATSSPVSGATNDFSSVVTYTVTAENESTTQEWQVEAINSRPFITSWNVVGAEALEIELNEDFSYDFSFVWKDESENTVLSGRHTSVNGDFTTTLPVSGTYTLEINGDFPHLVNYPKNQLLDVLQWGDIIWGSFSESFRNWTGVDFSATDLPDLSEGPNMFRAFSDNPNFNADLSLWDVSQVTTLQGLFNTCPSFNSDISQWSVENVANMESTFNNSGFNGDISQWNVSNVTRMVNMFLNAASFDQDLSEWTVSSVTNMSGMFNGSGLSVQNYDKFLINIAGQTVEDNVTLGATGISHCLGADAVTSLTNDNGWTINDEGAACSSENDFLTFKIPGNQAGDEVIDAVNHTVNVSVNLTADLTSLTPTFTLSAGAIATPSSSEVQDFTAPVNYEVISTDSTVQQWTVTVTNLADANTETDILTFQLSPESLNRDLVNSIDIDSDLHVITINTTATLSTITPQITLSLGATISPASEVDIDLSDGTETYVVIAEDGATEQEWTITVNDLRPVNDLCSNAIEVFVDDTVVGSSVFATSDAATTPICGTNARIGLGVWYKITGNGESITVSTCGANTNFDTSLGLYSGSCEEGLICITGNDDDGDCGFGNTRSRVIFNSIVGEEYLIVVDGFGDTSAGQFDLTITSEPTPELPANDDCATAETITVFAQGEGTPTSGNNTNAALFPGQVSCASFFSGDPKDVWFTINSGLNTTVEITLTGVDEDGEGPLNAASNFRLAAYDECGGNSIICDTNADGLTNLSVSPNTDYWLQVWNDNLDDVGTFTIIVNDGPNTAASLDLEGEADNQIEISRFVDLGNQVGVISADDAEGHEQVLSITSGNDEGIFALEATSGTLTVADIITLRSSVITSFSLTILSTDQGPGDVSSEITITVDILDNNAPVLENQVFTIDENTTNGTVVATLSASDLDEDLITFDAFSSALSDAFELSSAGELSVLDETLLDFENDPVITLEVSISDDGPLNLTGTGTISINLIDVNEVPEISDATFSITSGSPIGFSIGVVDLNDQDTGQTHTFAITSDESAGAIGIDEATGEFTVVDPTALQANGTRTYRLTVEVTDDGTPALSGSANIVINVFGDTAPVITSSAFAVNENTINGTVIGTLQATDAEGDDIAFSLVESSVAGAFSVNATGDIAVANQGALDFETNNVIELTVSATDEALGLLASEATITITINDVNESFSVPNVTFNIGSSAEDGSIVGQVTGEDPDGDDLSFSITAGNSDNIFVINATSGIISVSNGSLLNPAETPQYTLTIEITDGEFVITSQATINVFANAAPVFLTDAFAIDENNEENSLVGTIIVEDENGIQSINIISGNEDGIFELDGNNGELRVASSVVLNHEENQEFNLLFRATDNGLGNVRTTEAVTITINDVNEFDPVINSVDGGQFDENSAVGTVAATVNASDDDTSQTLAYTITAGNDAGIFAIDQNGQITNQSVLDFEAGNQSFDLTVEVRDDLAPIRSISRSVEITLNDVNETHTLAEIADQNGSVDSEITFTVEATDPENDLTFSFAENSAQDGMQIEATTGVFSWTPATGQFGVFELIINVNDGEFTLSETVLFTILNNATDILSFELAEQTGDAVINSEDHTVSIEVARGTDITGLVPTITISGEASVSPETGIATDLTNTVSYAVTAGNGDTQEWSVTVTEALNTETDILTFVLGEQTSDAVINSTDHTVVIEVARGTDVSALIPTIALSVGAFASPASGVVTDFSEAVVYTVTAEDGTTSQEWTVTVNAALNTATDILTFELAEQTNDAVINSTTNTVAIKVAFGTDVTALSPTITLSEGATSDPVSGTATNFTSAVTYTITAEDGTTQDWAVTVTVEEEPLNTDTDILTFVLAEQTGAATINTTDRTISIEVAFGTDVTALTPSITLSEGATSNPTTGTTVDFTNAVTYTVTSEDGTTTQDWVVTVTEDAEAPDTDTDILTFVLAEQTSAATINAVNHTVSLEVTFGTDVTTLTPSITLSEGATSNPTTGTIVDFTNAATYTVTAEDGTTTQDWVVTVTEDAEAPDTDTDILTFVLAEQTSAATINAVNHTVSIEIAFGTDVTTLTPSITLSEGATSNPATGTTVDFTNAVTYTVTAEDGTTIQNWTVTVIEDAEELDTDTDILTFVLAEQTSPATINAVNHTISIEVTFGTDVTALTSNLTLSEGATSDPATGTTVDFTNAATYTVTAEDGTTIQNWTVTVTIDAEEPDTDTDILTFVLAAQTSAATINATAHTVAIEVVFGTDATALTPAITLSEGATSNPATGTTVDFTNSITYTVTAEDGTTIQDWTVTVTEDSELPDTDTDILTFTLAEQISAATINAADHTVAIEVAFGTDVTALAPVLTLSEGANSDPASGVAIDFTSAVTYTVTAEDGTTTQEWTVTVTEADAPLSVATDILTFVLAGQTRAATINTTTHTVAVEVAFGTDVTRLSPTITLSEGATSDPTSGATVNFTNAVTYTVTAEDGTTVQNWTVMVTIAPKVLGFEEELELAIYPNPVSRTLHVKSITAVKVYLTDLNGRVFLNEEEGVQFELDLGGLQDGIYMLIIRDGERTSTRKIIKRD